MAFAAIHTVSPPLAPGRAVLFIAASLLLHALVVFGLRERLVEPLSETRPTERTLNVTLVQEAAPPATATAPGGAVPRRNARRTAAANPPPEASPKRAEGPAAPRHEPASRAGSEAPERVLPVGSEAAVPASPEAPATAQQPVLSPQAAAARAASLAMELGELGGAIAVLPASGGYVYKVSDARYPGAAGTTAIAWRVDPATRRYESSLHSTVPGGEVETIASSGSIRRFGLAPERYVETRGTRAERSVEIDWQRRLVTFGAHGDERPARDGMQDELTFRFQLMVIAQQIPATLRAGATVALEVAGTHSVDLYQFLVVGNETVATAAGPIETIKLDRGKVRSDDARVEVWLAPSRGYLPVRLRFTDASENVIDSVLESVREGP